MPREKEEWALFGDWIPGEFALTEEKMVLRFVVREGPHTSRRVIAVVVDGLSRGSVQGWLDRHPIVDDI